MGSRGKARTRRGVRHIQLVGLRENECEFHPPTFLSSMPWFASLEAHATAQNLSAFMPWSSFQHGQKLPSQGRFWLCPPARRANGAEALAVPGYSLACKGERPVSWAQHCGKQASCVKHCADTILMGWRHICSTAVAGH
jgi:hypothetical protein